MTRLTRRHSPRLFLLSSTLFLVTRLSSSSSLTSASTLKFVQILFRHGDRNPNRPWGPNDPNPESTWPQGWGQLTDLGKEQLYELGEQTRKLYAEFLSKDYKNEEIYVRSTGRDRALMSAQCFLAGLYPVDPETNWSKKVAWQPIPIHSKTIAEDWIMRCTKVCPETTDFYLDHHYQNSPSIAAYVAENKDFIDFVTKLADLHTEGDDVKNMKKMWKLGGNLHIARRYNKTLPQWATNEVIDQLVTLRVKKFESQASSSPQLTKLSGGPLLGHILANFDQFRRGSLRPDDHGQKESGDPAMKDLKLMVFSGHDTNMVFLLSALNLFAKPFWPAYAANLFLELHEIQGRHYVQILYQDGVAAERVKLKIPGCVELCPLDQLIEMSRPMAVSSLPEFKALCVKDEKEGKSLAQMLGNPLVYVVVISLVYFFIVAWSTRKPTARSNLDGISPPSGEKGDEKKE